MSATSAPASSQNRRILSGVGPPGRCPSLYYSYLTGNGPNSGNAVNLVWLKRDLRATDHQPLARAAALGPTAALFIVEPEWQLSQEFSWSHYRFALECLRDLEAELAALQIPLIVRYGEALSVLSELQQVSPICGLFSHEETGLDWSYKRDIKVKSWCRERAIPWQEFRQFGVIRGLKSRDQWSKEREKIVLRKLIPAQGQGPVNCPWKSEGLKWELLKGQSLIPEPQRGGRQEAKKIWERFLDQGLTDYIKRISSPNTAFEGCSRISPYLSWGSLSLSEVFSDLRNVRPQGRDPRAIERSRRHLESRLSWHCHFIQKLESEPEIEFQNFNRKFDGLRESEWNEERFHAWCRGETGFPMIDACMRALHRHGWINFRMRAMLMSFASYQLWLHWRRPAQFLAKYFLDFEPGIHFSQVQMQSGVTGINTVRIYSPAKQQRDQDPDGSFIRQYLPELASLNPSDLANPSEIPPLLARQLGFKLGRDYPEPIVDPTESFKLAQRRIFQWRGRAPVREASREVFERHGSRKKQEWVKR